MNLREVVEGLEVPGNNNSTILFFGSKFKFSLANFCFTKIKCLKFKFAAKYPCSLIHLYFIQIPYPSFLNILALLIEVLFTQSLKQLILSV